MKQTQMGYTGGVITQLQARRDRLSAVVRRTTGNVLLYIVLCLVGIVTVFPFVWVFFTSFKGPTDAIFSVPPQLIPKAPTFDNYSKVWDQLPVWRSPPTL